MGLTLPSPTALHELDWRTSDGHRPLRLELGPGAPCRPLGLALPPPSATAEASLPLHRVPSAAYRAKLTKLTELLST